MNLYFQQIPPSREYHTQQQGSSAGTGFLPYFCWWLHQWVICCQCKEFTTWKSQFGKNLWFVQCCLSLMSCITEKPLYSLPLQNLLNIQLSQHEEPNSFLSRQKLLNKIMIHNRTKSTKQPFKKGNKDIAVCATEMKQRADSFLFLWNITSHSFLWQKEKAFYKDQH